MHTECHHGKKTEIIDHCPDFETGTCRVVRLHTVRVSAPSLCVSCFRAEEARIDALFDEQVRLIRGKIAEYEAAQTTDRQVRGRARGAVDENVRRWEGELLKVRMRRYKEIRIFRAGQGVWGDG